MIMLETYLNVISFLKVTLPIGTKVNEVVKTQPTTYMVEDINGEIIEGKYYEQELLKSKFDSESNNKVLESLGIYLNLSNDKKSI